MGRSPSISKLEVAQARAQLRADDAPHGIIAIRKQLGRGSPHLIGRFLEELDGTVTPPRFPAESIEAIAEQVVRGLSNRLPAAHDAPAIRNTEALIAERDNYIAQLERDLRAAERRTSALETENIGLDSTVARLRDDITTQREQFDAWRRDHRHDRALLATRIEVLAQSIGVPAARSRPKPQRSNAEQLDLYGDPTGGD